MSSYGTDFDTSEIASTVGSPGDVEGGWWGIKKSVALRSDEFILL